MLAYDIVSNRFCSSDYLDRAIISFNNGIIELGFVSPDSEELLGGMFSFDEFSVQWILKTEENLKHIMYSNRRGGYILKDHLAEESILWENYIFGRGGFPYSFNREYEAVNCFDLFNGKQEVLENVCYPISTYFKYTFGAEFETYSGYIPENICYRDGLIPLRDGSLDGGIEYSTVVLEGNKGFNLLKQQINTLKKYTYFNKECSLHFHIGGFPVDPKYIWTLYNIWKFIQGKINSITPRYTFHTSQYKNSGKDYCLQLPIFKTFNSLYNHIAGQKFFGSLTQVHPDDPNKAAKWNCHSRYFDLNLLNMLCYKGPKTIEFRFLRPTYNFHKILLWLYIFNAVLQYSEKLASKVADIKDVIPHLRNKAITLESIIDDTYPRYLADIIKKDIVKLQIIVNNQTALGDYIGAVTEVENMLIDPDEII